MLDVAEMKSRPVNARGLVDISARLCDALLVACFSFPRSSLSTRRTLVISVAESKGALQNVHGPRPSFMQITLPH